MSKEVEQNSFLLPEKPSYPWQVLEADGETWLIVRWKEKVTSQPLSKVSGVSLEKFSWTLVDDIKEKCFYCGEIAFQVSFQELDITQKKFEIKEPWQDEHLFNKRLFTANEEVKSTLRQEESRVQETTFSTLLLDDSELPRNANPPLGNKTWDVSLPWRCWLRGKGSNEQPILKKVHVAQVGLYTLLLEAVIKLARKQEFDFVEEDEATVIAEETIWQITEDFVGEILGLSVERGLRRCFYDVQSERLHLQHLKKISVVYVSSYNGGERFLIASGVREELLRIKSDRKSLYPVEVVIRSEQVRTGLIGENKVFNQSKSFCKIQSEFVAEKEDVIADINHKPVKQEMPLSAQRKKPGEKWFKKRDSLSKSVFKTVLTIKI